MTKYKLHQAVAQYEFIEAEYDTLVEAKSDYDNIKKIWEGEKIDGMSKLNFSKFAQRFLLENKYYPEEVEELSPLQKWWLHTTENVLQSIKRNAEEGLRADSSHRIKQYE